MGSLDDLVGKPLAWEREKMASLRLTLDGNGLPQDTLKSLPIAPFSQGCQSPALKPTPPPLPSLRSHSLQTSVCFLPVRGVRADRGGLQTTATNTSNGLPVDFECHMEEEEECVRTACFFCLWWQFILFPVCFSSRTRRLFDLTRLLSLLSILQIFFSP